MKNETEFNTLSNKTFIDILNWGGDDLQKYIIAFPLCLGNFSFLIYLFFHSWKSGPLRISCFIEFLLFLMPSKKRNENQITTPYCVWIAKQQFFEFDKPTKATTTTTFLTVVIRLSGVWRKMYRKIEETLFIMS